MPIDPIFCYVSSMWKQIEDENGDITTDTEETSKSLRSCIKKLWLISICIRPINTKSRKN